MGLLSIWNNAGFGPRPFGRAKTMVTPIAMSGSTFGYREPSVEVYRAELDRGINLVFWDSTFKNMTKALLELSPEMRSELFIMGTIAFGGPKQIREGLQKKLRLLGIDKLSSYQLGWVRSNFRVRDSVLDELMSLRERELCDNIGLSIHKRTLAYELSKRNIFDIFMLRYNAAHRGLESDFLDKLDPHNRPSILAYTATRWRKLLTKPSGWQDNFPRPGDLYRFPLSHPFVDAVCMSPYRLEELESNLSVLQEGPLDDQELESIRQFGDIIHESQKTIIGDFFERSARL